MNKVPQLVLGSIIGLKKEFEERNIDFLKSIVRSIYASFLRTDP